MTDKRVSDLPGVSPSGADSLYLVKAGVSDKIPASALVSLALSFTGGTGPTGTTSTVPGPTGAAGANNTSAGPTGAAGSSSVVTGPTGVNASLSQASPTPSLAVPDDGTITVTHPAVTNGKIVPVAKINTAPVPSTPQYDPATIGRTGSVGVDVEVTHPTDTTTVFKNVTGSVNDFEFKVLTPP